MWLDMVTAEDDDMNSWCLAGYKLVARGQAAVLLVAGREGVIESSRLRLPL